MKPTPSVIALLTVAVSLVVSMVAGQAARAASQTTDLITQGRQALDAERVDEAITTFEKAIAADSKDPAALAWLGSAQVRKARSAPPVDAPGWVKKGFNTLDEAVERFPEAFVVYMVRGITALRVPEMFKKTPVAVSDLRAVVAMKDKNANAVPDSAMPSVYLNLGLAHKKNGQAAEARAAWETARKLYPSAPESDAITKELQKL